MSSRYAVLSFVLDDFRDLAVPIGVVLWSESRQQFGFRVVAQKQSPKGTTKTDYALVDVTMKKIRQWCDNRELPYFKGSEPTQDQWWEGVRSLLCHRVQLSESRPISTEPDADWDIDLENLFDAVVRPRRSRAEHNRRTQQ
jgi:hypothetical protein